MGVAWHEASVDTLAFFDEAGEHLKTIYIGRMPESHMATLATMLKEEVLHALTQRPDLTPVMASDGAPGSWAILEDSGSKMPQAAQQQASRLLDIFHAGEHLQDGCDAIDGGGTVEVKLRPLVPAAWAPRRHGWIALLPESMRLCCRLKPLDGPERESHSCFAVQTVTLAAPG